MSQEIVFGYVDGSLEVPSCVELLVDNYRRSEKNYDRLQSYLDDAEIKKYVDREKIVVDMNQISAEMDRTFDAMLLMVQIGSFKAEAKKVEVVVEPVVVPEAVAPTKVQEPKIHLVPEKKAFPGQPLPSSPTPNKPMPGQPLPKAEPTPTEPARYSIGAKLSVALAG